MNATCSGCGSDLGWPDDGRLPPSSRCRACPPIHCGQCGEMDHFDSLCSCWRATSDIPLADLKGLFADIGLSLDPRSAP